MPRFDKAKMIDDDFESVREILEWVDRQEERKSKSVRKARKERPVSLGRQARKGPPISGYGDEFPLGQETVIRTQRRLGVKPTPPGE